nr:carbohydrate-binding family 9-like protein [Pedobacter sp. ASV19]
MNLNVLYCHEDSFASADLLSKKLVPYPRYQLTNNSWPQISTNCRADFAIAHTGRDILLNFSISNDYFHSVQRPVNGEVHLDNCVEFFIAFGQSDHYYNIEFNCLGVGKMAYGNKKLNRILLDESVVHQIRTSVRSSLSGEEFNWEMTICIPAATFIFHEILSFEGITARANFYKCGDGLPNPHYLCWNKITSPIPDFHRPDCFGYIHFLQANGMPVKKIV